jgi:hypothetical protein
MRFFRIRRHESGRVTQKEMIQSKVSVSRHSSVPSRATGFDIRIGVPLEHRRNILVNSGMYESYVLGLTAPEGAEIRMLTGPDFTAMAARCARKAAQADMDSRGDISNEERESYLNQATWHLAQCTAFIMAARLQKDGIHGFTGELKGDTEHVRKLHGMERGRLEAQEKASRKRANLQKENLQ